MARFTDVTGELTETIKSAIEIGIDVKDRLHELLLHDKNIENVREQLLQEMPDLAFIIDMVVNKHKEKTFKDTNTNPSLDVNTFSSEQSVGNGFKTRTDTLMIKDITHSSYVSQKVKDRVKELTMDGKTDGEILTILMKEFPDGIMSKTSVTE
ncbi:hypothetical protein P9X10_01030 [Bacillus cereus]|nr:hypothetical protein [Bacillus cereus]